MIELRLKERFRVDEDIMFARRSVHAYCYFGAKTLDYSEGGMCFMSRYQVEPGDNICLRMIGRHLQSFSSLDDLTCMAEVKWCEPVGTEKEPGYRIGLRYMGDSLSPLFTPWQPIGR